MGRASRVRGSSWEEYKVLVAGLCEAGPLDSKDRPQRGQLQGRAPIELSSYKDYVIPPSIVPYQRVFGGNSPTTAADIAVTPVLMLGLGSGAYKAECSDGNGTFFPLNVATRSG